MLLAGVGLYGSVSYNVRRLNHEVGVRIALGARTTQIVALVALRELRVAAIGSAIGIAIAIALGRVLQALFFETSPSDPIVLVGVALGLPVIALIASAVPLWRATHVDPAVAMRANYLRMRLLCSFCEAACGVKDHIDRW